jgi:hypothetical protein
MIAPLRLICSSAICISLFGSAAFGWGALAIEDDPDLLPTQVNYGLISGYAVRAEALSDAVRACRDNSSESCRVVLVFRKCGAYAASPNNFGVGTSDTLREAEQRALASCGDHACEIIVADCD